ncbi:hypothetical protein Tco_1485986 [Tanacetum coccineum]
MGCREEIEDMLMIRLRVEGTNDELFTSEAWLRVFNINERIYSELHHKFYSTYEFDEVCPSDELNTKKIIKWMKKKGVGSQAQSQICCGQFITRIARALDATTLRELIEADGRLIRQADELAAPRAAAPREQRASLQVLYERMGSMEICQDVIERMSYRE